MLWDDITFNITYYICRRVSDSVFYDVIVCRNPAILHGAFIRPIRKRGTDNNLEGLATVPRYHCLLENDKRIQKDHTYRHTCHLNGKIKQKLNERWSLGKLAIRRGPGQIICICAKSMRNVLITFCVGNDTYPYWCYLWRITIIIAFWIRSFPGIGYAMFLMSSLVGVYYNMILAWAFFYLWSSITSMFSDLPWKGCENEWNTHMCQK